MNSVNQFEEKVRRTIEEYSLADKEDRIIVACSGGKDSTTALYLLDKFGYRAEGMIIDLLIGDWSQRNLENIKRFSEEQGIKLHTVSIREELGSSICYIRSQIKAKTGLSNCMICGIIKRWLLNKKSRELGATKLATGHNLDDEAETILMNFFTGLPNLGTGLGPKTQASEDEKFVPRIKPLYFCLNREVERYSKKKGFPVLYDPCPCLTDSLRKNVREGLSRLTEKKSSVKRSIVNSYLKLLPVLRERLRDKGVEVNHCNRCGEPSRNQTCKTCEMFSVLE